MSISAIHKLIEKARIKEAINASLRLAEEEHLPAIFLQKIRNLSTKYHRIQQGEQMGTLSRADCELGYNQVNMGLLGIVSEISEEQQQKECFIQAEVPQALKIIQPEASSAQLQELTEQVQFLIEQHHGATLELATLILDNSDQQADSQEELKKLRPLIQSILESDSVETKVKLAVPLLKILGIANFELETELKLNNPVKALYQQLKTRWKH